MSVPDVFGTAALRGAVLDAWTASPARFREDANAEEDLVRGGYRDRWFVELAQNAADAAARAGRPTHLAVTEVDGELRVAGEGEPLTADGVAALASLRASAQRDHAGSVGRFGVGFAAVTALSDAPRVVSSSGSVAFDRDATARAIAAVGAPALVAEVARRDGAVPALRLVWPSDETPDGPVPGTEVRLPLRPGLDADALLADARAQAPDLLLALPWLSGISVSGSSWSRIDHGGPGASDAPSLALDASDSACSTVTITGPDGERAWRVVRATGPLPADAGLAVEDRARDRWEVTWAAPVGGGLADDVLHAPTPTDERTTLPARLLATVPLDPDRRHVRVGATTEHVLAAAAARYPDLVRAAPPEHRIALVPRPGLPGSAVDGTLREGIAAALRGSAWLPGVAGDDLVPARATVLDPELDVPGLAAVLDGAIAGLVEAPPAGALATLTALGVTRLDAAGLVETLAGSSRSPGWWRELYAALAPAAVSSRVRDELTALPVPLVDGRTVLGARGVLLPRGSGVTDAGRPQRHSADTDRWDAVADALAAADVPGLRVAHPEAAHPLLATLGATDADPSALLDTPALREAVERSVDDADAGLDVAPLAALVLALVTDDAPAFLGALALPDADGEHRRADELLLPGGALAGLVDADGPFGVLADDVAAAHRRDALIAVGVLDGFAVLRDEEPTGPDHDLDDEETWWSQEVDPEDGSDPVDPGPLVAVRDLELVADDRWPAAWAVLVADRDVREAVGAGRAAGTTRPYTAWWLARHGRIAGRAPTAWRLPDAAPEVVGLYDLVPEAVTGLDAAFLAAVGARVVLAVRDTADAVDLLDRLADPARTVDPAASAAAHAALAGAVTAGRAVLGDVDPPAGVRTADGGVRDADPDPSRAAPPVVLDHPWLLAVLGADAVVLPGTGDPRVLADLLDLGLASERLRGLIRSVGTPTSWRGLPEVVAWASARGLPVPDGEVVLHDRLHVLVTDDERPGRPTEHTPRLWREPDGTLHADDPVRALAAVAGRPAAGAYSDG